MNGRKWDFSLKDDKLHLCSELYIGMYSIPIQHLMSIDVEMETHYTLHITTRRIMLQLFLCTLIVKRSANSPEHQARNE